MGTAQQHANQGSIGSSVGEPAASSEGVSRAPRRRLVPLVLLIALLGCKAVSLVLEARAPQSVIVPTMIVFAELLALRWAWRSQRRGKLWAFLRASVCAVGVLMIAFVAMTIWVDRGLARRHAIGDAEGRIWSTRGLALEGPEITRGGTQNSVGAVRLAFERGAEGVEVDVFYDRAMEGFVVSHDRPYNTKGGRLLMLGDLFGALGDYGDRAYWLDWKKLRHLTDDQLADALSRLEALSDQHDLWDRLFVEGEDPFHLKACERAGFKTIVDSHPLPDGHVMGGVVLDFYKALYYFGNFTVLGVPGGDRGVLVYGENAAHALRDIPAFVYHVPSDEGRLMSLLNAPAVRVVLLRDQSDDRFSARPLSTSTR